MNYSFSENIQRGIIFLLKHDLYFFSQIIPLLKKDYFEFPSYQVIFESIQKYYDKYRKIPSDEILLESIKVNLKENESISDYEDDLFQINKIDGSTIENREFILDLVENYARRCAIKDAIKQSITLLNEDRIDEIEKIIKEALLINRNVDTGLDYFNDLNIRIQRNLKEKETDRFKTVFPSLNKTLEGGLCRKEIAMVVAPPAVGKSLYLANQGVTSLLENRNVLYISLEMSQDRVANRFDSILSLLPQETFKNPEGYLELANRLGIFQKNFKNSRLIIKEFPTGCCNVNQIRSLLAQLRLHAQNFIPDIILVDYLELLRSNREIQSEYEAQERISQELRSLAVEYNCLVFTATQSNREGSKVQTITDLEIASSFGKNRIMDYSFSLNQNQAEHDAGKMRVYIMKARNAKQKFIIPVSINYSNFRMEEIVDIKEE